MSVDDMNFSKFYFMLRRLFSGLHKFKSHFVSLLFGYLKTRHFYYSSGCDPIVQIHLFGRAVTTFCSDFLKLEIGLYHVKRGVYMSVLTVRTCLDYHVHSTKMTI